MVQRELFHPVPKFVPRKAQEPGRPGLVPLGQLQGLADELPLDLFEDDAGPRELELRGRQKRRCSQPRDFWRQVAWQEISGVLQDHGALDDVPQFAHVPGPVVVNEQALGLR